VTVYNHFADLGALLPACTDHWLTVHPMPDLGAAMAEHDDDPPRRLVTVLAALYGWYRETAPMQRRVNGERAAVPELDAWLARSSDPLLAGLADALAAGLEHPGARALVALALDFWTWDRLDREGLDDDAAAALMAGAAAHRGSPAASSG
jgi:AcrR family transcriptional regulator